MDIASKIDYICGKRWNDEYNAWLTTYHKNIYAYKYHYISKINWTREIKKLHVYANYNWYCISSHPNITWDIIQANPNSL